MYERMRVRQFLAVAIALGDTLYALEQRGAASLLPWLQRYAPPSSAPGMPEWYLGLLNVRGTVQMVVDLRRILGDGPSDPVETSRLVFIEHGTAQLGLLVDREIGVRTLTVTDEPIPLEGNGFISFVAALDSARVLVLDGAKIVRFIADELRAPAYLL